MKHTLKPFAALAPGEAGGARNVLGEQVYSSPVAPALLKHFSQHPDELTRLETVPPHLATLPPGMRTRAHIEWMVKEVGKLEGRLEAAIPAAAPAVASPSTITAAPPPPPQVSRTGATADPIASALKRDDLGAFMRADLDRKIAKARGAA